MNNARYARAVKYVTILCVTLLSALLTFTTRLTTGRGRFAYMAVALFAFALLSGIGCGLINQVNPNDAKDIWAVGY